MLPAIILFAVTYVLMIGGISNMGVIDALAQLLAKLGAGILRKEGHDVKNSDFFKIGIPFTLSAIIPAYILVWVLFGV